MSPNGRASSRAIGSVLIVDANGEAARELGEMLAESGICCSRATNTSETLRMLEELAIDVVVADPTVQSPGEESLLDALRSHWPSLPVILATEDTRIARAVEAVSGGAVDFVTKPFEPEEASFVVHKALERVARTIDAPPPPNGIAARTAVFGESSAMQETHEIVKRAAPGTATILVRGESGTGKELAAFAIHERSARRLGPFVKIDCAALPEQLLESELFGYEKGAFTGAASRKPGRVELADGGTLFLDEIGELTASIQAKLLRLLQDREFERLGGTKTIRVDVRVIAATHRDLETMVDRGQFRQDLFYRLNVVPLWLPPLRARRDDVEVLAKHFCRAAGMANAKPNIAFDARALKLLRRQRWPGNVRQLQNFVERLVVLGRTDQIGEDDVRAELERQVKFVTQPNTTTLSPYAQALSGGGAAGTVRALSEEMRAAEKSALERALQHASGNRSQAARLLGISRSTLYEKLSEYGLM